MSVEPDAKRSRCEAQSVDVAVICCGAPKRSMGWYHCKQLLEQKVPGARLTDIVEPHFMGAGKSSPAAADFFAWITDKAKQVETHASIIDMPRPKDPKLAIICGRTADNPKLFRQAIDQGFSHIYLEKPGAPTAEELEDMNRYSKSKNVPVCMGFNRNLSKYVLRAKEFGKTAPRGAKLTLGRNDAYTFDALDECFERNAEGMMKNMMIHELVVLISHFEVRCANIAHIEVDTAKSVQEVRKGVKDFSKVHFTLHMKDGLLFTVWGNRCDGEYAEAVFNDDEGMTFKTVRPDPKLAVAAAEIEKDEPGCMPFFYLQDGEYSTLKRGMTEHIAEGKEGVPGDLATIETAIEALKMCDLITEAITQSLDAYKNGS